MNVDANPGAVTRHMQENLCSCQKLKITVISGFRTKVAAVAKYRAKINVHCRGFWLPYKNYCVVTNYRATLTVYYRGGWLPCKVFRGCQLPSTNYCAIPWWLLTAANVTEMKNRYRGKPWFIFPVQLTKCRAGNLTRWIHTFAICVTIHTRCHPLDLFSV